jgi:4-amino-4-deoxy-L-arabinose transferase-like glycosyltransferase
VAGLPGINGLAIYRGDEKFYIHFAQEMLETGNYLVPTFGGEFHLTKPPLYYWLVALCYRLFGLSLFSARLPSLLAAGLAVALVYGFTFRLYGSVRGAVYAALATASSYTFYWHSKVALTDMVMTLGILTGAFFFLQGVISGRRRLSFFIASVGVGVAGMAKGHVGMVVALLPILCFLVFDWRSPNRVRAKELAAPWVWGPALLLSGWWYLYLVTSSQPATELAPKHPTPGQTLSEAFFEAMKTESLEDRTSGGLSRLINNLGFYPLAVLRGSFPWSLLVLAGFLIRPRPLIQDWKDRRQETLMLLAMILPLLFLFTFVILQQERSRYLLPIFPAVSILAARYLVLRSGGGERPARLPLPAAVALGLLLAYNLIFVVVTPWIRGSPLEELCRDLKPRLRPGDIVLVGAERSKQGAFATALLGHKAEYLPVDDYPEVVVLAKLAEIRSRVAIWTAISCYLITSKETWDAMPEDCRLLKEAVGLDRRTRLQDILARIRGGTLETVQDGRLSRMVLIQFAPFGRPWPGP